MPAKRRTRQKSHAAPELTKLKRRYRNLAGLLTERDRAISYLILAGVLGIMLWTVAPTFSAQGYLTAWDAGGHLLKAWYFAHHFLSDFSLSGYFPVWHGGFSLFQFYPPLLYYLLGPLTLLMPPELALRFVTAGLWLALVPATYYFLRSWHLDRIIAALGTTAILALNASFGIGLGALYGVGLLPNGLGCVLAIFALGRLKRDLSWPDRGLRQFLLTGSAVALLILAHTFSAYWFLLAAFVLVAAESLGHEEFWQRNLKRFGIIIGLGAALSAYWWVPLALGVGGMGQTGPLQQNSLGTIFTDLVLAKDSGGLVVALLAAAGLAYLGVTKQRRALGFFGGLAIVSLALSLNLINGLLPFSEVIASSQYVRFQAFFSWTMIALAAFGLAGAWQLFRKVDLPYVPYALFGGGFAMLFVLVVVPTLREKSGFINVVDNAATAELPGVEQYLAENLRPGESVLSQFDWDSRNYLGSPHFVNQRLPLLNDRIWDLDGNFPEGTDGASQPVLIASTLEQTSYLNEQRDYLISRGVRYVITTNPTVRVRLADVAWLKPVHVQRVLTVYEIDGFNQPLGLPPVLGAQLESVRFTGAKDYQVTFRQPVTLPAGTPFGFSDHPWLRFDAAGQRAGSSASTDHRLTLDSPLRNVKTLTISYQPSLLATLASRLSFFVFVLVIVQLVRPRWLATVRSRLWGRWNPPPRKRRRPQRRA